MPRAKQDKQEDTTITIWEAIKKNPMAEVRPEYKDFNYATACEIVLQQWNSGVVSLEDIMMVLIMGRHVGRKEVLTVVENVEAQVTKLEGVKTND
jgi:hypothetical protein